ncbi:MAG: hypothetical protein ACLRPX_07140 [Ruthenibacterium sp.]
MARALESAQAGILAANEQDLAAARGSVSDVMLDRLRLTPQRVAAMAAGLRSVAALKCPVGETLAETTLPNGLVLQKRRVPMGVVAIIYESRPNVTADAAALCLQSGNVCAARRQRGHTPNTLWTPCTRGLPRPGCLRRWWALCRTPPAKARAS